jgi:hypothetical protein
MSVEDRIAELLLLPSNWDSYGGKPVHKEVANWLLHAFDKLPAWRDKNPAIAPTSQGGLVASWFDEFHEVDLRVEPDGSVSLYLSVGKDLEFEKTYISNSLRASIQRHEQ